MNQYRKKWNERHKKLRQTTVSGYTPLMKKSNVFDCAQGSRAHMAMPVCSDLGAYGMVVDALLKK